MYADTGKKREEAGESADRFLRVAKVCSLPKEAKMNKRKNTECGKVDLLLTIILVLVVMILCLVLMLTFAYLAEAAPLEQAAAAPAEAVVVTQPAVVVTQTVSGGSSGGGLTLLCPGWAPVNGYATISVTEYLGPHPIDLMVPSSSGSVIVSATVSSGGVSWIPGTWVRWDQNWSVRNWGLFTVTKGSVGTSEFSFGRPFELPYCIIDWFETPPPPSRVEVESPKYLLVGTGLTATFPVTVFNRYGEGIPNVMLTGTVNTNFGQVSCPIATDEKGQAICVWTVGNQGWGQGEIKIWPVEKADVVGRVNVWQDPKQVFLPNVFRNYNPCAWTWLYVDSDRIEDGRWTISLTGYGSPACPWGSRVVSLTPMNGRLQVSQRQVVVNEGSPVTIQAWVDEPPSCTTYQLKVKWDLGEDVEYLTTGDCPPPPCPPDCSMTAGKPIIERH